MSDIKTILFDLDGTLLPMDEKIFEKLYFLSLHDACKSEIERDELISLIWKSTKEMVLNTEHITNEEVFFTAFRKDVGEERFKRLEPLFTEYYKAGFDATKQGTSVSPAMIEAVSILKEKGYSIRIATNPMFPRIAIEKRVEWTGIDRSDIDSITFFEESHYCKPQIQYYQEILERYHLDPTTCMMVGNNALEDMIASKLGMTTYLVDNCLLSGEHDIEPDYRSDDKGFLEFVKTMKTAE